MRASWCVAVRNRVIGGARRIAVVEVGRRVLGRWGRRRGSWRTVLVWERKVQLAGLVDMGMWIVAADLVCLVAEHRDARLDLAAVWQPVEVLRKTAGRVRQIEVEGA